MTGHFEPIPKTRHGASRPIRARMHRADPKRVPAVEQATGDLDRMRRDRELGGPSLAIASGDDNITPAMMADPIIRCSGVIRVMSNLVPKAVGEMVAAQAAGESGRAVELCRDALRHIGRQAPEYLRPMDEAFDVGVEKRLAGDAIGAAPAYEAG